MRSLNVLQIPRGKASTLLPHIVALQKKLRSEDVAFLLTVEPESEPYLGKLSERVDVFAQIRDGLSGSGQRVGVLCQTTLGHGERYAPPSPAPFQRMVDTSGKACQAVFCPLDEDFGQHIAASMTTIAAENPAFILIDDDFRLSHAQNRQGCFCPLHLALFAERHHRSVSREELLELVTADTDDGRRVREQWHDTEQESLLQLARIIRVAIDAADPTVPAGLCATPSTRVVNDALARTLAGPHRPLVRVAGAVYLEGSAKVWPLKADAVARQRRWLGPDVEVLIEADTYPHHPYSVSARTLRAWLMTALMLGLDGAKAWVEPTWSWRGEENPQFADVYARLAPTAAVLPDLIGQVRWRGASAPIADDEPHRRPWDATRGKTFLTSRWIEILGRMGVPHVPGGHDRPLRVFDGPAVEGYSAEQWKAFFADGVLLDGTAALTLSAMGFAPQMGVRAEADPGLYVNGEHYRDLPEWNGTYAGVDRPAFRDAPEGVVRLTPVSSDVQVLGDYVTWSWRESDHRTVVAPAVTVYRNSAGGRVAIYAAADLDPVRVAHHFVNPARRGQLSHVLSWLCPPEYPIQLGCNTDLYALVGDLPNNAGLLTYALNLQADTINTITVTPTTGTVDRIDVLDEDGHWKPATWHTTGTGCHIDVNLAYLDFAIMRIRLR